VTGDPTTGQFLLRAIVPNPDHMLMPGMYVRAIISGGHDAEGSAGRHSRALRAIRRARHGAGGGAQSKVQTREVRVARTVGDQWLIG